MRPENQGSTIVAIYIGAITDRNLASNFYAGKDNLVFSLRTDSASTICVHPFWSATESGFLAMPGREAISGEPLPPAGLVAGGKFDAALDLPPGIVFFAPVLRGLTSVLRNGAMVVLSGALQLLISPAVHSAEHERSGAIPIFQHGAGRRAAVIVAVTDGATGRALEGAVRDVALFYFLVALKMMIKPLFSDLFRLQILKKWNQLLIHYAFSYQKKPV